MAIAPSGGLLTDLSGDIDTGGAAQELAPADSARRYFLIQNRSAEILWISFVGDATVGGSSLALKACTVANDGTGGILVFEGSIVATNAISILGATTSSAFTAWGG